MYEPEGELCRNEALGIVAEWGGGRLMDGLLWRSFRFSHDDWESRLRFEVIEQGIEHVPAIGNLSENEISVQTTIAPDASVTLRYLGQPEVLRGAFTMSAEFLASAENAIMCLYNQGDRHGIRLVTGQQRPGAAH